MILPCLNGGGSCLFVSSAVRKNVFYTFSLRPPLTSIFVETSCKTKEKKPLRRRVTAMYGSHISLVVGDDHQSSFCDQSTGLSNCTRF